MEFEEVIKSRHAPTVGRFLDLPLGPDAVARILDCGRRGPSAGFSQGFEFLVLEGPEQTGRYWDANPGPSGLRPAPLLIVLLAHRQAYLDRYAEADKSRRDEGTTGWPVPYWLVDTSFAGSIMLLAAIDEGLGAVFFGVDDGDGFRRAFGVPAEYFPVGAIAIGQPA